MIGEDAEETDMKAIVCFDVDMTLLDHATYQVPDSAMEALDRMRGRHYLVLATGRDMDTYYSRQIRDLLQADAIIHSNGTRITVGDQVIYESRMPRELVRSLLDFAEAEGLSLGATIGDEDYYTHPEQVTRLDIRRWGESGRQYQDPWKLLERGVRTLAYIGGPEGAARIEQAFPELKCPLFAGKQGADVLEKKNSKANGLKRLCRYYGVDQAHTYAFGDSMNDYEILKEAGVGIAMGNALEELKEAADYVTDDISRDGVYKACLHFGLLED